MPSEEKMARWSNKAQFTLKKSSFSKITESISVSVVNIYILSFLFIFVISKTIIALPQIASLAWLYDTICNSLCIIYIISLAQVEAPYNNNNSSLFQSDKEAAEMFFTGSPGEEAFIYTYIKNKWIFCGRVSTMLC